MNETSETDAEIVKDVDVKIHDLPDGGIALKTRGSFVPADFARKLERERDEARNDAHNYKEGFRIQSLRAEQAERERDNLIILRECDAANERDKIASDRDKWREYAQRLIAAEFDRLKGEVK